MKKKSVSSRKIYFNDILADELIKYSFNIQQYTGLFSKISKKVNVANTIDVSGIISN